MCDMSLFLQCVETALRRVAVSLRTAERVYSVWGKFFFIVRRNLQHAMKSRGGVVVSVWTCLQCVM